MKIKMLLVAIAATAIAANAQNQPDFSKVEIKVNKISYDGKIEQAAMTSERFVNQLYAELGGK